MAYKKLKYWFDKELTVMLSNKITCINPDFESKKFIKAVEHKVPNLELKDRIEVIADELKETLTNSYPENVNLLIQILGPENKKETGMFTNYYWIMPIAKYIEKYGMDYYEISMDAIAEITKRSTGEYTIRPYIEVYPVLTLKTMLLWSENENKHLRRLSCEGLRPRLPWAKKMDIFIENPKPIIPILNNLKDDKSRYVQKSVANCLNDILKDNLEIGKVIIEKWKINPSKERQWIIKHSLRNLLKKQDDWAMKILSLNNQD